MTDSFRDSVLQTLNVLFSEDDEISIGSFPEDSPSQTFRPTFILLQIVANPRHSVRVSISSCTGKTNNKISSVTPGDLPRVIEIDFSTPPPDPHARISETLSINMEYYIDGSKVKKTQRTLQAERSLITSNSSRPTVLSL